MVDNRSEQLDLMAERYGRRPSRSRGLVVAVVGAVALLVVVVTWLIVKSAGDPVQASLHSWDEPRGGVLSATVEIRRDAGLAVTCDVVAVDLRRVVVGQLELEVPAGPEEHLLVPADIPLEGDGIVPELRGCQPADE